MGQFSGTGLSSYRGQRIVFRGLEFEVSGGEMLHLIGSNGSGKSTLLHIMAGLLPVIEGQLLWDGTPLAEDRDGHRARLLYVGHADAVKGALSVAENLEFWCKISAGGDIIGALERFNLNLMADLPARYLSAGQRRRLHEIETALAAYRTKQCPPPALNNAANVLHADTESVQSFHTYYGTQRGKSGIIIYKPII